MDMFSSHVSAVIPSGVPKNSGNLTFSSSLWAHYFASCCDPSVGDKASLFSHSIRLINAWDICWNEQIIFITSLAIIWVCSSTDGGERGGEGCKGGGALCPLSPLPIHPLLPLPSILPEFATWISHALVSKHYMVNKIKINKRTMSPRS